VARFLYWILIIPLGAGVIAFTVSNRGRVLIDLWPAPFSFETPIFAALLVSFFGGFLLGGIISFISASKRRLLNRQLSQGLENARREEEILRDKIKKLDVADSNQPSQPKTQT
jgi:hypothetical protein